jgi:HSP20 family protein
MAQDAKDAQAPGGSSAQQSAGKPNATSTQQSSSAAAQSATQRAQADQQRTIQTSRDADRSLSTPRASPLPVRGIGASPFWLMRRFAEDMDHMLEDFGFVGARTVADRPRRSGVLEREFWSPEVETFRRGDRLVVRADLPGVSKNDVKVELDDNALSISGERSMEHQDDREGYYVSERSYGRFYRAVPLPEGVSGDQCEATFKDGVLEVTLRVPTEEQKAKQIEIK